MSVRADAIKLAAFCIVTVTVTIMLATALGNFHFTATHDYRAVISNASGLTDGDDVKVNGVPVGKVTGIDLVGADRVDIDFTAATSITLTSTTRGAVRYKNLIGDRYLELIPARGGTPLSQNGTIPSSRMSTALDIDKVVNGFRPLLEGLKPEQMNRFTASIIEIFAGQAGRIGDLITQISELTTAVAQRSTVIDRVIANLNTVVAVADNRNRELDESVDMLQQLVTALNSERTTISGALVAIGDAGRTVADLLSDTRPAIKQDIAQIQRLAHSLNVSSDTLQTLLGGLPKTYQKIARAGGYGNFINFFLCGVAIHYPGPAESSVTPMFTVPAQRCQG